MLHFPGSARLSVRTFALGLLPLLLFHMRLDDMILYRFPSLAIRHMDYLSLTFKLIRCLRV